MRAFAGATLLLFGNSLLCGLSVFSAQTALLALGLLTFLLLLWAHGYVTARSGIHIEVGAGRQRRADNQRTASAVPPSKLRRISPGD